jgi:hypothetical protein
MDFLVSSISIGLRTCWSCFGQLLISICEAKCRLSVHTSGSGQLQDTFQRSCLRSTEFRPVASICSKFMIFLKIIDILLDHLTEDYGLIDDAMRVFVRVVDS